MCQQSRFDKDKVKETRKPTTVYKIVEVLHNNSSCVRSYYQQTAIELGFVHRKCSLAAFRDSIGRLKMINRVSWNDDKFGVKEIYSEGIHAFPTLDIAEARINDQYTNPSHGHTEMILECEIPAWSGVIYGFDGQTLVTNRIKYVKLIK